MKADVLYFYHVKLYITTKSSHEIMLNTVKKVFFNFFIKIFPLGKFPGVNTGLVMVETPVSSVNPDECQDTSTRDLPILRTCLVNKHVSCHTRLVRKTRRQDTCITIDPPDKRHLI